MLDQHAYDAAFTSLYTMRSDAGDEECDERAYAVLSDVVHMRESGVSCEDQRLAHCEHRRCMLCPLVCSAVAAGKAAPQQHSDKCVPLLLHTPTQ